MRRLLIVGCGDIALRMVRQLRGGYRIYALSHSPARFDLLRTYGITPIPGDLDKPETFTMLGGLAHDVVHFAPPPSLGTRDTRTAHLLAALTKGKILPHRLIYISTSGVYGHCGGEIVPETRPLKPQTERARRRLDAERRVRDWGMRSGVRVSILRVPGIYAEDRLPFERLKSGTPALLPDQDAYTNHIHADDLARIVIAALRLGRPGRVYNTSDDSELKMGDYFDLVADSFGLPRPPRIPQAEAGQELSETLLSFMQESRRLANRRMKRELQVKLHYPVVADGIAAAQARDRRH
ncbi:MAG TPA: SDR family oxidoreductase [Burkholderiales bacterium]|nr:SDR family oxidoreductase [Burkholderiales bacterium]